LAILIFCFLTLISQVGGLVYLISLTAHKSINSLGTHKIKKQLYKFSSFLILYCLAIFLVVPIIAKPLGRVPLPLLSTNHLQPLNVMSFFLNRNYVRPELRQAAFDVAKQMNEKYPGTIINYLDANFPFFNKYPLIPHVSHNDGKKLDLSFCYRDKKTNEPTNECPSFIGYGICEDPLPNEVNFLEICKKDGNWQYALMSKMVSQKNKHYFLFDSQKTKTMTNLFANQKSIGKIFIEPHLKERLKLRANKIKFHGCSAVRHDDHIHFQLK
jgi:hypothetical protein